MKKTLFVVLGTLVAGALVFAYVQRVSVANQFIKDAPIEQYALGEEVTFEYDILTDFTMNGYSLVVNDATVLAYEAFLEKYGAEDEYTIVPEKIYDVSITLKNNGTKDSVGVNMLDFYIQKFAAHASIDPNLYTVANPELEGKTGIALRENSEMEFHLPFALWEYHYSSRTWEHLEEQPMDFVATLYPVKKVIVLR